MHDSPMSLVIHPCSLILEPADKCGSSLSIPLVHPPAAGVVVAIAAGVGAMAMAKVFKDVTLRGIGES